MAPKNSKANKLADIVSKEAFFWGDKVAIDYHARADTYMETQWKDIISPILCKYPIDMRQTIDFACGRGRNALKLKEAGATNITLVDVNPENIEFCKNKFSTMERFFFSLNNGFNLSPLTTSSYSFVYSFDAMVHFDTQLIYSYIKEFERILQPGGVAFVHHSNFTCNPGNPFRDNPHWRNFMSASLFKHWAIQCGFHVLKQNIIDWGGVQNLDCITVMKR